MVDMTKSRFMNESQRSDQDTRIQMEFDLGEPFAIREIDTRTNLVTKTKIGTNLITEIITNMTKVEEVISLVDPTPRCNSMAQDFAPPTSQ
jgi:hypothetical protein